MRRDLLDYSLPSELIADRPSEERDGARLLVVGEQVCADARVADVDRELPEGALVIVNDTRVVPARLLGHKADTGGKVELLLVRELGAIDVERDGKRLSGVRWSALGRASKGMRRGTELIFGEAEGPRLLATVLADRSDEAGEGGLLEVALCALGGEPVLDVIDALGHMPLPPYMKRADAPLDRERYQTVFAQKPGAIAAPTAGLHLSERVLERLASRGIERASVTLHVGLGTFQPVTVDDLDHHPMHRERFEVPESTALAIARARARGAPVVAIGTTVVRALESAADHERAGYVRVAEGETALLIQPGYRFRVVDRLLTNFHLPQSTLLALVSAFAGRERVLAAYEAAIARRYRFYSYGDAMLLSRRDDA